jgi:hypothetical protein
MMGFAVAFRASPIKFGMNAGEVQFTPTATTRETLGAPPT